MSRQQWVADALNKNIASGTRPQAANINFGYAIPGATKYWNNKFTDVVTNGWHVDGIMTFYYGTALTVTCSAASAPIGYWTGTPTGGIPFRCQQVGGLWLPSNATPSSVGSTAPSNLWYNFNPASFVLPSANSLGIGSTPPTLTYGPGVENVDLSLYKEVKVWGENKTLTFKFEAFNALNHFNPSNPNSALTLNFNARAPIPTPHSEPSPARPFQRAMGLSRSGSLSDLRHDRCRGEVGNPAQGLQGSFNWRGTDPVGSFVRFIRNPDRS